MMISNEVNSIHTYLNNNIQVFGIKILCMQGEKFFIDMYKLIIE
jgi:hypothetical protein